MVFWLSISSLRRHCLPQTGRGFPCISLLFRYVELPHYLAAAFPMPSVACVWLIVLCLVPQGEPVPIYRLGLILPSTAEADALGLGSNRHVTRSGIESTYLEAVRDVNNYFRENFTVLS